MNRKKALVVGGSNGIGLSIGREVIRQGYHLIVVDRVEPAAGSYESADQYTFYRCNLLDFNEALFQKLAEDSEIELLMITAGIGRVADFSCVHSSEIENTLTINTVSTLKILRIFYDRICSQKPFYTGVLVSIAGLVSSPLFSVYAASKAADARFIESVNIELEVNGTKNRILDVSPGSIEGTRFNGGENDVSLTTELAKEIIARTLRSETLFIPNYDAVYKRVLEDYQADPHAYGLHSYQYKKNSGRVNHKTGARIGYLSGTFDLFHVGHLNLLRRAKQQCDYLIVGVHDSGAWKGKQTFIPFDERKEIVGSCKYVDKVVDSCLEDAEAWDIWHYNKLFVGSDYKGTERFQRYEAYFKDKDVEIIYFPYTQGTSSTQIRNAISAKQKKDEHA